MRRVLLKMRRMTISVIFIRVMAQTQLANVARRIILPMLSMKLRMFV